MNPTLFAATALLLLSAGLALANDIVPGSETAARDRQSAADWSVIAPTVTTHERIEAVYTYPAARPLTERTESKAAPQPVAAPSSTLTGTLVPGSDSF